MSESVLSADKSVPLPRMQSHAYVLIIGGTKIGDMKRGSLPESRTGFWLEIGTGSRQKSSTGSGSETMTSFWPKALRRNKDTRQGLVIGPKTKTGTGSVPETGTRSESET